MSRGYLSGAASLRFAQYQVATGRPPPGTSSHVQTNMNHRIASLIHTVGQRDLRQQPATALASLRQQSRG
jgi:hypothetical protein